MPRHEDPESAVRRYLMFLADPQSLVEPAKVAALEKRYEDATDPIARLRAAAELDRARRPDGSDLRDSFIRHARAWADANGIPSSVFREFGIPADVIRAARLAPASSHPARRRRNSTGHGAGRQVTIGSLEQSIVQKKGEFTLADVAREFGGSPMTIRKAVRSLLESGRIVPCDSKREAGTRGRSPSRFRVAAVGSPRAKAAPAKRARARKKS